MEKNLHKINIHLRKTGLSPEILRPHSHNLMRYLEIFSLPGEFIRKDGNNIL